jgi:hypothetical protein
MFGIPKFGFEICNITAVDHLLCYIQTGEVGGFGSLGDG